MLTNLQTGIIFATFAALCWTPSWKQSGCQDINALCKTWADRGVCTAQQNFMTQNCPDTCGFCRRVTSSPAVVTQRPTQRPSIARPNFSCGQFNGATSFGRSKRQLLGGILDGIAGGFNSFRPGSGNTNTRPQRPSNPRPQRPSNPSPQRPSNPRPQRPNFGNVLPSFGSFGTGNGNNNPRPTRPNFNNVLPSFNFGSGNTRPPRPSLNSILPSFGIGSGNTRPPRPSFNSLLPSFGIGSSNTNTRPPRPSFNNLLPSFDVLRPGPGITNTRPIVPSFNSILPGLDSIRTNIITTNTRPSRPGILNVLPSIGSILTNILPSQPTPDSDSPPVLVVANGTDASSGTVGAVFEIFTNIIGPNPNPGPGPGPRPTGPMPTRPTPVPIQTQRPFPQPRPPPGQGQIPTGSIQRPVAIPGQSPFPASIQNPTFSAPLENTSSGNIILKDAICGSAPITDRFLISAAHCFTDPRKRFKVRLGAVDISRPGSANSRPQDVDIERVYIHPEYRHNTGVRYNDIALLKTVQTIRFNADVIPFCILPRPSDISGAPLTVSGFGYVNATHISPVLQEAELVGLNDVQCENRYREGGNDIILRQPYPDLLVGKGILCAASPGKDACEGDSGGPLTVKDARGRIYLIGIVSLGASCFGNSVSSLPGLYTDVAHFVSWIDQVLYGIS